MTIPDSRLELDILNFKELSSFQAFGAIPYSRDAGVLLPAPFGWIVDGTPRHGALACLYQRGLGLKDAQRAWEWMYVNLLHKSEEVQDLAVLLKHQEGYLKEGRPDAEIKFIDPVYRQDRAITALRAFKDKSYPAPEYTGFVDFGRFIFFCVLFTAPELEEKNLRKLRYVLRRVLPLNVKHEPTPATSTGR